MGDGPISQPGGGGVLRALVAAGTVFELSAGMFLRIQSGISILYMCIFLLHSIFLLASFHNSYVKGP